MNREDIMVGVTRNALLMLLIFVALTACSKVRDSDDKPNPSSSNLVQPSFFGMHIASTSLVPWPETDNFATVRIWDLVEYDSKYVHVNWQNINPSDGIYNWTLLDTAVKKINNKGKDILYTLGGDIPQWASTNPNGTGCANGDGSCYAPEITKWQAFVTAITTRYDGKHGFGKIKYWEIWNEPNSSNFWGETINSYQKMVSLALSAYPIIKAANSDNLVVSPAPQGPYSYDFLDKYFEAGGDAFTDIISFHSYLYGAPELITTLANEIKRVKAKYPLLAGKPLWDTEHSWGDDFNKTSSWPFSETEEQQTAWLARHVILSINSGIERSFWYMWNGFEGQRHWGWLFNENTKTIRKPGIAYNEVYNWLVNAQPGDFTLTDSIYQCQITRPGGYKGLIVWASSPKPTFTKAFTVPAQYIKYRMLDATTVNISEESILTMTMMPILLENQ